MQFYNTQKYTISALFNLSGLLNVVTKVVIGCLRMKKFTIILLQKNNNHNFLIWWHQMAFIYYTSLHTSVYSPVFEHWTLNIAANETQNI